MQVMYPMSSSSGSYAGCCWVGEGNTAVHDVIYGLRSDGVTTAGPQSGQTKQYCLLTSLQWAAIQGTFRSLTLLSTIQGHLRSWQQPPWKSQPPLSSELVRLRRWRLGCLARPASSNCRPGT